MKKLFILLAVSTLLCACGGGGGDSEPVPQQQATLTAEQERGISQGLAASQAKLDEQKRQQERSSNVYLYR